jgi:hypothetical protein
VSSRSYLGAAESASEETLHFTSDVSPLADELAAERAAGSVGVEQIAVGHGRAAFGALLALLLGLDLALGGLQVERVVAMAPGELVVDDFLASGEDLHVVLQLRVEAGLVDAQHLDSRPDDAFVPRRHLSPAPVRSPQMAERIIRHFLSHRSKSALHNSHNSFPPETLHDATGADVFGGRHQPHHTHTREPTTCSPLKVYLAQPEL